MVTVRNPFKRQDSVDAVADTTLHHTVSNASKSPSVEKDGYAADVQDTLPVDNPYGEVHNEKNLLANGKERPIEVSSTALLSSSRATQLVRPTCARLLHACRSETSSADSVSSISCAQTAEDIANRCISLEDDPNMLIHTFRMYFLGIGLTCFAAVLGQIF